MISIGELICGYPGFSLCIPELQIPKEQITCIIGPNGSGKSTLIKTLSGGLAAQSGEIRIAQRPLHRIPLRERARIMATVSQHSEYPDLSVTEFLLLGRIPHQRPFQFHPDTRDLLALEQAIEATAISPLRNRRLLELSGGERQLCQIARALVQEPRLLLLDEPNSFLDIGHQVQSLDLIQKLVKESGLTVVIVLHDLNLAGEYAHNLLLLDGGKPFKWGKAQDVLRYDIIETVYKTPVVVSPNPLNGKPHIFMVSAETLKRHGS